MTLTEFLAARLDEKEAAASGCINCGQPIRRAATSTGFTHSDQSAVGGGWQGVRCAREVTGALPWPGPARTRALREVAAGRAILAEHERVQAWSYPPGDGDEAVQEALRQVVRILAAADSGHPDYDPAWAPA